MNYLLLLILPLFLTGIEPVEWLQPDTVTMEDTLRDEEVTYVFRFRNVTGAPLIVDNVRIGCGCTATEWQDTPVAPGGEGSIKVTYDSAVVGYYRKYVKIYFKGHRGGHKLWMEGFVESRD